MRFPKTGRLVFVTTLVIAAGISTAVAKTKLESQWLDREVTIDAAIDEWHDSLTYIDGPDVFVGALNDDRFLYVCIHSRDSEFVSQAMRQGLIIKLDTKGSDALQIQFPMGAMESGVRPPARGAEFDREEARRKIEQSLDTFLILGPGSGDRRQVPVDNRFGVELHVDGAGGEFVYELKIPLARSEAHPFAIDAKSGATVSVALDTPEIDRGAMGQPMGGGRGAGMGGGMPGGGMPGGGMGGGRGGAEGQRPELPDPLKVRAKIHLAPRRES